MPDSNDPTFVGLTKSKAALLLSIFALFVASLSAVSAVLAVDSQARAQANVNQEVCVAINNENTIITDSLNRSKKNTPRLAYYQAHPGELRTVLREINRELDQFRPRSC